MHNQSATGSHRGRKGKRTLVIATLVAAAVVGLGLFYVSLRVAHAQPPSPWHASTPQAIASTTRNKPLEHSVPPSLPTDEAAATTAQVTMMPRSEGGEGATCERLFGGFSDRTVDAASRLHETMRQPLARGLVDQLLQYKRKVRSKLARNAALWKPYWTARMDPAWCFSRFPECAVFNRSELILDSVSEPVNDFMVRKCCVEHMQMLRAVRSLYAALEPKHIVPWLTAGTLLGAVRERGTFIAWDTDVDVLISPDAEAAVVDMLRHHHKGVAGPATPLQVVEPEEEDDVLQFAATAIKEVKDHAHGRMIGVVYGTAAFRHEEASRVEIWVAQETKKMQASAVNLPTQRCLLYDLPVQCPSRPLEVLNRGYGPHWCVPCKAATQNCKAELEQRYAAEVKLPPARPEA